MRPRKDMTPIGAQVITNKTFSARLDETKNSPPTIFPTKPRVSQRRASPSSQIAGHAFQWPTSPGGVQNGTGRSQHREVNKPTPAVPHTLFVHFWEIFKKNLRSGL